ncbi:MAG: hypothetical protein WD426_15300 [Anditalea sp.]
MNYHNKKFKQLTNSENGETSVETLFHFRSSGFYQMYEAIEKVDKTRILVGPGVDGEL